jgi:hypothetical protein
VLDSLVSERCVNIGVKRQQVRRQRDTQEQRALAFRKRAQNIQVQGWPMDAQHRPQRRQIRACQRLGNGQGHVRTVLTMRQDRQAGQASISKDLPQLPDSGIRLVIEVHLQRVSHPLTMPEEPEDPTGNKYSNAGARERPRQAAISQ